MRSISTRLAASALACALALAMLPAPVAAQSVLTLQQMEQRAPNLGPRQIMICDRNGDGLFDRGEQACVNSMNDAMSNNGR